MVLETSNPEIFDCFDDYEGDGLSGCQNCGTDCIGQFCNSCSQQAMIDNFS